MMTAYLTKAMAAEQEAELEGRTPADHIAAAQRLLSGKHVESYHADRYYNWEPPTAEDVARAHAHAALASAMLAAETQRSARSPRRFFSGGQGY